MNTDVKWKMQELQRSILDLTRNAEQYEEALVKTTTKADEINKMISNFQLGGSKYSSRDDGDDFESSSPPVGASAPKSYGDMDYSDFSSESRYSSSSTSVKRYGTKSYEPDEDVLNFESKYSSTTSSRFGGAASIASPAAAKPYEEEESGATKYSSPSSSRVKRSDRLRQRRRSRHDLTIV